MAVRVLTGDCRIVMRGIDAESVDCIVTSPPYWGLRDYGTASWRGGDAGCDHVKTTARKDGSRQHVDEFNGSANNYNGGVQYHRDICAKCGAIRIDQQLGLEPTLGEHIANMVHVFDMAKRVLKKSGTLWLNYGDSYAAGVNGCAAADTKAIGNDDRTFRDKPFSTIGGVLKPKDLCMVPARLAIALQEAGWWLRSEIIWHKPNPMPESVRDRPTSAHEKIYLLAKSERYFYDAEAIAEPATYVGDERHLRPDNTQAAREKKQNGHGSRYAGFNERYFGTRLNTGNPQAETRNKRNVWTVPSQPFSDAHFATFPPALIEPCILAGCPKGGTVLDPFGGAGTTGLVADRLARNAILIELNSKYAAMAQSRIVNDLPLFAEVSA